MQHKVFRRRCCAGLAGAVLFSALGLPCLGFAEDGVWREAYNTSLDGKQLEERNLQSQVDYLGFSAGGAAILPAAWPKSDEEPVRSSSGKDIPDDTRWGRMAIREAVRTYEVPVQNCWYAGSRRVGWGVREERLKLTIAKEGRRFGVWVAIRHETATGKVISVTLRESSK